LAAAGCSQPGNREVQPIAEVDRGLEQGEPVDLRPQIELIAAGVAGETMEGIFSRIH